LISKILSTAVKLYLRSQVTQIKDLQVKIVGKNKQILQGYIPQVLLSCDRAVYQGLHLSQIELNGLDIAVNLSEVIKKKPLRLLEPILVEIQVKLDEDDLQASLDSELLQSGLKDLWQMILAAQTNTSEVDLNPTVIEWHSIAIEQQVLNLKGRYKEPGEETKELCLSTRLSLADSQTLCLSDLCLSDLNMTNKSSFAGELKKELKIDLGTDIAIALISIEAQQIKCAGKIKINN